MCERLDGKSVLLDFILFQRLCHQGLIFLFVFYSLQGKKWIFKVWLVEFVCWGTWLFGINVIHPHPSPPDSLFCSVLFPIRDPGDWSKRQITSLRLNYNSGKIPILKIWLKNVGVCPHTSVCVWNRKVFFFPLLALWANREPTENPEMRSYKLLRKLTKEEPMSLYNCSSTSESDSLWQDRKGVISRESPLCVCNGNVPASTVSAHNVCMQGLRGCCPWGPSTLCSFHTRGLYLGFFSSLL